MASRSEKEAEPQSEASINYLEKFYIGTAEQTFYKSPQVPSSYDQPYNSDDLYRKTGDYSIYEDMLNDDQVSVCLKLKKDLVLGAGFSLQQEDENEEVKEFISEVLEEEFDGFMDAIEEILSAYEFGFSLTEKIFETRQDGKISLKSLRTRHPNGWLLYQDDFGNVTKFEQRTSKGDIDVNPKSLIHFVNNKKFQNPYGKSDLRAAYQAWFTKRQIVRYMAIFMEKASSPTPVGKFDRNAPQEAVTKLFESLKKFQSKTALVIPKDIEVEFLEAKNNGDVFKSAINLFNMFIGRALFVPDLVGLTGGETTGGSYTLGKEQMRLFFLHIQRRRETIEQLINYHIIKPLVVNNFGDVECPKFKFKPLDETDAIESAKLWLEAVKGKTYKPNPEEISYFRNLVKFPDGDVEFQEQMAIDPRTGLPSAQLKDQEQDQEEDKEELETKEEKKKETFALKPPGDYHKKVDFKVIKAKLEDYDKSISTETVPVINKIFRDLFDQIERKKIIQKQSVALIDDIKLKYLKELKQIFKASFVQIYKDSQSIARSELFKGNFKSPIPSDKFLETIEDETFQYIGDWEYMITKQVRIRLIQAIKDGESFGAVLEDLRDQLGDMSDVSIERYARTKHTEVFNNARLSYFEDSGVVAAYQYSAILDDRTSDVCAGLDGKIFSAENAPVPPLHFNCRSVLIPITKYEEFEEDKKAGGKDIDKFLEENIGSGFSKFVEEKKKKEMQPTDAGVVFRNIVEGDKQITIYSFEGKDFYKSTAIYDETGNLIKLDHERIT